MFGEVNMLDFETYPIIAAVRTEKDFNIAINSDIQTVFLLNVELSQVSEYVTNAHKNNKLLFLHLDFVNGLSNDAHGVKYVASMGIDGIISTRSNVISAAHECGLMSVQRFFMIDSRSVDTALETLSSSKASMVEIMPGIAYKAISKIKKYIKIPIIAGGLINTKDECFKAIDGGASMISTGTHSLWQ